MAAIGCDGHHSVVLLTDVPQSAYNAPPQEGAAAGLARAIDAGSAA